MGYITFITEVELVICNNNIVKVQIPKTTEWRVDTAPSHLWPGNEVITNTTSNILPAVLSYTYLRPASVSEVFCYDIIAFFNCHIQGSPLMIWKKIISPIRYSKLSLTLNKALFHCQCSHAGSSTDKIDEVQFIYFIPFWSMVYSLWLYSAYFM